MAPSGKAQYLGYHLAYDTEEGFDVPMTALEKHHHRERHRPATKPGAHGGERLTRHHARPHVLARCHSWPAGDDEADDATRCMSEEDEKRAPALPHWEGKAPTTPSAPPQIEIEIPAAARPGLVSNWAAFAGRLKTDASKDGGLQPQQWPRRGSVSSADSDSQKAPPTPTKPTVAKVIAGGQHLEAADERLMSASTAKMAANLLPTLLRSAELDEGGEKISLGRMKVLLESAVSLASLHTEGRQPVTATVVPKATMATAAARRLAARRGGEASSGDEESMFQSRDLRGKGWMKEHKAERGVKKMEQVSFKSAQRLAQFDEAIGYFSDDEHRLGRGWALHDKARSIQHGGNAKWSRRTSDHHE